MGGNALKQIGIETERKGAKEYHVISKDVLHKLCILFPNRKIAITKAYANKESFGDCDILLESDNLPNEWIDLVSYALNNSPYVSNGDVVSFCYMNLQIDIIKTKSELFTIAEVYFAFNDLGNLMGRIAHRIGFKYGQDGLWLRLIEGTEVIAKIHVSSNPFEIFRFLGYKYEVFKEGFNTLEDVFKFAVSSEYFNKEIFYLENRNHKARVRDMKRPSYMAFLEWIKDIDVPNKHPLHKSEEKIVIEKAVFLNMAFSKFPGLIDKYLAAIKTHENNKQAKLLWNGKVVSDITGLQDKDLGAFIKFCKDTKMKELETSDPNVFTNWVIEQTEFHIKAFVLYCLEKYNNSAKT